MALVPWRPEAATVPLVLTQYFLGVLVLAEESTWMCVPIPSRVHIR
jgi:hypothetical protein